MPAMLRPWPFLQNFILCLICIIPLCWSQSIFPQNIETSYPFPLAFHVPTINTTSDNLSNISQRPPPPPPLQDAVHLPSKSTSKKAVIITVAVSTAAATLLLSLCLLFFIRRCILAKHEEEKHNTSSQSREGQALVSQTEFKRFNGNFNGFILEENGLDVIYWKKPARRKSKKNEEDKEVGFVKEGRRRSERVQETRLLHGMSSTEMEAHDHSLFSSQALPWRPPPPAPLRKPPPPPPNAVINSGQSSSGKDEARLKPLHWDKVNTNVLDHEMVWNKIDGGSFRFNGDLMEALFGYVATNKKSPPKQCGKHKQTTKSTGPNNGRRAQISILDSRTSRNIAIILKSLSISRQELHDALMEGQGLDSDTLEKLVKITPNQEQESQILEFDGDPLKLGDAESFIFHLLKAVPTAFTRLNAMLFRSNFNSEVIRLRDFSQTLGVCCEELKRKGVFTKLLEATLRAGNRLNSGDAQAFNLNSLSDVKSTGGKTTLLDFVVEEVMRSEGKRRISNINSKEREIEYTKLGLSAVESLTSELPNVKKASTIDYEAFMATCPKMRMQISEIRKHLRKEGGEYKRKMMEFIKFAEEEVERGSREQKKALEVVKKTNEWYETGDRENPLIRRVVK